MSKRIIILGTWEGKPIEWLVLKEEGFASLVISRDRIGTYKFDNNQSNNNWDSCDLRKFLKNDFYKFAFTEEEKKKIINVKLTDSNNVKDNIFILSEQEVEYLSDDDYNRNHRDSCSYCIWTRTKENSQISHGYVDGCWCYHYANSTFSVRPAMWVKEK